MARSVRPRPANYREVRDSYRAIATTLRTLENGKLTAAQMRTALRVLRETEIDRMLPRLDGDGSEGRR